MEWFLKRDIILLMYAAHRGITFEWGIGDCRTEWNLPADINTNNYIIYVECLNYSNVIRRRWYNEYIVEADYLSWKA